MGPLTYSVLVGVMGTRTDNRLMGKINLADKICARLCPSFKFFHDPYGRCVVFADGYDNPMFLRERVSRAISIKDFTEMTLEQIEEFVLTSSLEHTFS